MVKKMKSPDNIVLNLCFLTLPIWQTCFILVLKPWYFLVMWLLNIAHLDLLQDLESKEKFTVKVCFPSFTADSCAH